MLLLTVPTGALGTLNLRILVDYGDDGLRARSPRTGVEIGRYRLPDADRWRDRHMRTGSSQRQLTSAESRRLHLLLLGHAPESIHAHLIAIPLLHVTSVRFKPAVRTRSSIKCVHLRLDGTLRVQLCHCLQLLRLLLVTVRMIE